MDTGLVIVVIVLVIVVGLLLYQNSVKPKNGEQKIVIDTKTSCDNVQLAPPPTGKRWSCVDGNWVLVDINGMPEQRVVYIIDRGRRSYRYNHNN